MVPDGDGGGVEEGAVVVHDHVLPYADIESKVAPEREQHEGTAIQPASDDVADRVPQLFDGGHGGGIVPVDLDCALKDRPVVFLLDLAIHPFAGFQRLPEHSVHGTASDSAIKSDMGIKGSFQ